jgi:hypothetical protein
MRLAGDGGKVVGEDRGEARGLRVVGAALPIILPAAARACITGVGVVSTPH